MLVIMALKYTFVGTSDKGLDGKNNKNSTNYVDFVVICVYDY